MNCSKLSLELSLVIVLPLSAVVACIVTLVLAMQHPAYVSTQVDRFGHAVAQRASP
jgi:hypothetical protein